MRPSNLNGPLISITAAAALLGSCSGGSQSQLAPAAPFQQSSAQSRLGQLSGGVVDTDMSGAARGGLVVGHPDHGRSWMAPDAATHALLYVSDYTYNHVLVYSYPQAKLVGTLTGFSQPDGICTDKKGDVWIVNNNSPGTVVEYKHGGKTPIAALAIGSTNAVACSVDPITGNLAVTVLETYGSGQGLVAIFAHAKGSPTYYKDSQMYAVYFCGYDNKGNLYVDGELSGPSTTFEFAEIRKGKKTFTSIPLKGATIGFPGNVQWDGKYVVVGDQYYQSPQISAIYRTTGAAGKIVGKTVLNDYGDIEGFWIEGKTVIGPDHHCMSSCIGSHVGFFNYPAGGKPTKTLTKGLKESYAWPAGAAVSQ